MYVHNFENQRVLENQFTMAHCISWGNNIWRTFLKFLNPLLGIKLAIQHYSSGEPPGECWEVNLVPLPEQCSLNSGATVLVPLYVVFEWAQSDFALQYSTIFNHVLTQLPLDLKFHIFYFTSKWTLNTSTCSILKTPNHPTA